MANTGSVAIEMKKVLDQVDKNVREVTRSKIQIVAKESVQKLRNTSPKKTGDYGRGWTVKKLNDMDVVVHNKTDYQLTHLLENGHMIVNKKGTYGRTRAFKHIAPVEQWAAEELPRQIMEGIE